MFGLNREQNSGHNNLNEDVWTSTIVQANEERFKVHSFFTLGIQFLRKRKCSNRENTKL